MVTRTRYGRVTGRLVHVLVLLTLLAGTATSALAQQAEAPDASQWNQDYLTGAWGGLRPDLASQGVSFEAAYAVDAFANVRGGARRGGGYLHNADLTLAVDAGELMGWRGASFFGYVLGNYGDALSEYVGDLQGVSNIEAPAAWQLYEAWLQQAIAGEAASVKIGLYDVNSEFASVETAGLYLGSAHGIGPDFSQSGLNGPSIFPATGLAARLAIQPTTSLYAQAAIIEAFPGSNGLPGSPRVQFTPDEGWLMTSEMGLVDGDTPGRKIGVGYWRYTKPFETLAGDGQANGFGAYTIGEYALFDMEERTRGVALYGRAGWANTAVHPIAFAWATGLVVSGPFKSRPYDQLGLAVATAHQGREGLHARRDAGDPMAPSELAIEFTYALTILSGIAIQPDIQFIHHPGSTVSLRDAVVVGTRLSVTF